MDWSMIALYSYALATVNEKRGKVKPGKHRTTANKRKGRRRAN